MQQSRCLTNIVKIYNDAFPENWIEVLSWNIDTEKQTYYDCLFKLDQVRESIFIEIGKAVLSGEFLLRSYNDVNLICDNLKIEILQDRTEGLKVSIISRYIEFNCDIIDTLRFYKLRIDAIVNKLKSTETDFVINALSRSRYGDLSPYFKAIKCIIEICTSEYEYSNNVEYIKFLILRHDHLTRFKSKISNKTILSILDATCQKIEFLLKKISHFHTNRKIEYCIDFKELSIDSNYALSEHSDAYVFFQWFTTPSNIPKTEIRKIQELCAKDNAKVMQMVLLMRYYSKVKESKNQVSNLIAQFDEFYKKLQKKSLRPFDLYALKKVKNYMHNCHLSLLCSKKSEVTFVEIMQKMDDIEAIQEDTNTRNYYPYKKIVEYLIYAIKLKIESGDSIDVVKDLQLKLNAKMLKFKNSYEWCERNHFYAFQLMWNECKTSKDDLVIFTPSSFCRPINYEAVSETLNNCKNDIAAINSEIYLYSERLKYNELKEYVDKSKKSYIEILGLFTAIVTFLISCITIFTNNNANTITLAEKVDHISILGAILLLFVSVGFVLNNNSKEPHKDWKFWFFLATSAIYIFVIIRFAISSAL